MIEGLALVLHLQSFHFSHATLNNNNLGLGVHKSGYEIGMYKNSYNKNSVYLSKDIEITDKLAFTIGVASGYKLPVIAGLKIKFRDMNILVNHELVHLELKF